MVNVESVVRIAVLWGWSTVVFLLGYVVGVGRGRRDRWRLHGKTNVIEFDRRVEGKYRGRAS